MEKDETTVLPQYQDGDGASERRTPDPVTRRLSTEMSKLYKEQFGRGPETVQTRFSDENTIIALIWNSLTPVEVTMREMGEHQRLRDTRLMFQHATEPKFRSAVEVITGRKVVAFMSGIDVVHDTSCEVFTLEPEDRQVR